MGRNRGENLRHLCGGCGCTVYDDRRLPGLRRFEVRELTVEQRCGHEVVLAL